MRIKTLSSAAALALILTLVGCKPAQPANSVSGTIEVDETRVASRYGGRVEKVFAQEGDGLTGGQLVAEISAAELRLRLTDDDVKKQIDTGKNAMPGHADLNEADRNALLDYLMLRDGSVTSHCRRINRNHGAVH